MLRYFFAIFKKFHLVYDQTQGYGVDMCFSYFTDNSNKNTLTPKVPFPFLGDKFL